MEKYKDFDAFFNELEQKPIVEIKLYNKIYQLPSELPALTILQTYRASKRGDSTLSDAKQLEIAFDMLGEDNVSEWCENGMSMTQLTEIMKWAAKQYAGNASNESGSDNGKK
jgi:hypothetical protein